MFLLWSMRLVGNSTQINVDLFDTAEVKIMKKSVQIEYIQLTPLTARNTNEMS